MLLYATGLNVACQARYEVSLAGFSSQEYDEFSPVVYQGGVVFCTNREYQLLVTHQTSKRKSLFNMFRVEPTETGEFSDPEIFSKELVTPYNDGPASFSTEGNLMVFSRNLDVNARIRNMVDLKNVLGLFFAVLIDGEWTNITPFKYNDPSYSIVSPCFSPDGKNLYFGSNMPGGYGGTDIYRSRLIDNEWSEPENLGPVINTSGNEIYPFVPGNGQLFFASDGHGGNGMKDIFLSRYSDSIWSSPFNLEIPINSTSDDFGIYTNEEFSEGYFSSNRGQNDDIFKFSTLVPHLSNCDTLQENIFCFEFWDEQSVGIDTIPASFEWEFSDGSLVKGQRVVHCFPGAGKYWAKLHIIDSTTDETFLTQSTLEFELEDHEQPFITSKDTEYVNNDISFSGLDSYLPGFTIEEYIWEFGDGNFSTGPEVIHRFMDPGNFFVKLGLSGYSNDKTVKEMKCVVKPLVIKKE